VLVLTAEGIQLYLHSFGFVNTRCNVFSVLYAGGVLQPVVLINGTCNCSQADCFINVTADISLPGFTSYVKGFHWIGKLFIYRSLFG